MNTKNTDDQKAESYALLALSRLFTDKTAKTFGLSLDDPAENYYGLNLTRSRAQWVTALAAFVGAVITLIIHFFYNNGTASLVFGVFVGIVTIRISQQIPEFPGKNVIILARAWAPNRKIALETGLVRLIADVIERSCDLSSYIVSGMPNSFRQSEIGSPLGEGWKIINDGISEIAKNIARQHKEAEQKGQPARTKALSIEYGTLSLFAKEIGMEIPDMGTLPRSSLV